MKIICLIDSLGSGGAQRQMVELAKGFKDKGHEIFFITYHNINFFKAELEIYNIPIKTIIERNYLKRLFKIRKEIREQKPDAVLSFLQSPNFIASFAGLPHRDWKLVVGERSANPRILSSIKMRVFRKAHFFADYVVSNSFKNIELVKEIIPRINQDKLKVIYNSVHIPEAQNYPMGECDIISIVIASSYRTVKNLDGLIDALQRLPQGYGSKVRIYWYGNISLDNNYFLSQQQRINKLGLNDILILGNETHDIYKEYIKADFVGLFSHYEGFPNAISEAMTLAKPVIVTQVSDLPLFVVENINGFLCHSHCAVSISKAICKAIESTPIQRKIMGDNNSIIAQRLFNKDVAVEAYLRLFHS
jgi:glycosyltransferase involved in cell wall biosynthesis